MVSYSTPPLLVGATVAGAELDGTAVGVRVGFAAGVEVGLGVGLAVTRHRVAETRVSPWLHSHVNLDGAAGRTAQ